MSEFNAWFYSSGKSHEIVVQLLAEAIRQSVSEIKLTVVLRGYQDGYDDGVKSAINVNSLIIIDEEYND